jgi:hypothetical protein
MYKLLEGVFLVLNQKRTKVPSMYICRYVYEKDDFLHKHIAIYGYLMPFTREGIELARWPK